MKVNVVIEFNAKLEARCAQLAARYQIRTLSESGRYIGWPGWTPNAA